MFAIREAIVVEGRYDKNTLSQVVDTLILETGGFGIFKNKEQVALLLDMAKKRGLIVLTDSDGAGFVIRNHLKSAIPKEYLKHAYIPDIYGKEKRKTTAGKEGKLGVEGMSPQIIEEVLRHAGATFLEESTEIPPKTPITKGDLFALGLSGGEGSANLRQKLLKTLKLPQHLSPNALIPVLNTLFDSKEVFIEFIHELREKETQN